MLCAVLYYPSDGLKHSRLNSSRRWLYARAIQSVDPFCGWIADIFTQTATTTTQKTAHFHSVVNIFMAGYSCTEIWCIRLIRMLCIQVRVYAWIHIFIIYGWVGVCVCVFIEIFNNIRREIRSDWFMIAAAGIPLWFVAFEISTQWRFNWVLKIFLCSHQRLKIKKKQIHIHCEKQTIKWFFLQHTLPPRCPPTLYPKIKYATGGEQVVD